MPKAKVYLDSNVYKFSATQLPRFVPRERKVKWGGQSKPVTVYTPRTVNPNDGIQDSKLKAEAELLPQVAALSSAGLAIFQISIETIVETNGLPDMDSKTGYFYDAGREIVKPPVRYSRAIYGGTDDWKEDQYEFLRSLDHKRFLELQKVTGAYQGEGKVHRNQRLDAFHLWCAEHNGSDFFLSLDFKLARVIARSKDKPRVAVVRPSELLAAISHLQV
jgi:hypothetical protein